MRLTLKNFRCYINQTFEFDDDTITLINGPSGQGKTTILLGIQFVLYGSINHKYLITHNKNSCEVILEYKNFKITRTKRPNILNVEYGGRLYEDKEAQVIVNKYFGVTNSSIFFMELSHLEKMEFLEKIINVNCNVKDLKNQIKIELVNLNKELAILDGQISNTEAMLQIIQKPDKIDKPCMDDFFEPDDSLRNLSVENLCLKKDYTIKHLEREKIIKTKHDNLMIEFNVLQEEISSLGYIDHTLHQQIENLSKDLIDLKVQNNYWNNVKNNSLIAEESLKELEHYKHINVDIINELKLQIEKINEDIKYCIKFKDIQTFNKLKNEYDEGLYEEHLNWQWQVNFLQNQLTKINIDQTTIKKLFELEQLRSKFEEATSFNSEHNIIEIQSQIKALKLKFFKSYNCSNCNHKLIINMDTLEMMGEEYLNILEFDEPVNTEFDNSIKPKLQQLEILKNKIIYNDEFIREINIHDINNTINLIEKYKEIENKIKQLGVFKPSISLINMEKQIFKLKMNLPTQVNITIPTKDLETLKDEHRDLIIQLNIVSQQLKIKNNLLKKIDIEEKYDEFEHKKIIDLIENSSEELKNKSIEYEKLKTKERLQVKLESLKHEVFKISYKDKNIPYLKELLRKINSGLKYYNDLAEYESYLVQLKKYKKVKSTLNNFIQTKESTERIYLKTLSFKQKVIEAEHESLQFMINIINTHLSLLLQDFFSEDFGDPIQIYLELLSDKRPQVNIVINYKGNKVDYKCLSTGEYARVKLAFDLTFKEILGENIIMLDECTANLDQDLSTKIFNKIKATFPSKTILVVAHQVITGTFDHVLNL
jgi:DNA repair exonuclease SbcCD ATPase subunit